ncbi:MBOAT family protein [Flavobacterium agricola]|uniref:MBOAT family protein n=1 Tax=Flavobacterium agricola TaxID=2870839 RepID=A0ABY6M2A1_9FLAO|nr:MBOAT family O-acyltransferase [Flavobacterium agricola]UYW01378.1 MBOAT family protein [Flavobacterium agricola]
MKNWFNQHIIPQFEFLNAETVQAWFTYNPAEPMLFNTARFFAMFLVFYSIYIALRKTFYPRLIYVICFSLFFYYLSSGAFFILIVVSSLFDYVVTKRMYYAKSEVTKKVIVTLSVIVNLGLLGYFKYMNFFIDSINTVSNSFIEFQKIALPVGISFFTFQSISYVVEIYRKEIKPTKSYIDYLFFISFFPQLVAGPIVRAKDFLSQIYTDLTITKEDMNQGMLLIIGGLIKKVVISDYISSNFVDRVYDLPTAYTPFENLMASYGYAIQIYCDFSGYSDMAIGIALLLGFKLPTNFNTPYQSKSITEFWRRWHISLSTWLKDFLYISVGGNRNGTFAGFLFPVLFFAAVLGWGIYMLDASIIPLLIAIGSLVVFCLSFLLSKNKERTMFTDVNLMTTMLLGGLWHGASLRYIVWGALHGVALAVHKLVLEYFPETDKKSFGKTLWQIFAVILTFNFVTFCWIFFRAKDFDTALQIITNIGKLTFDFNQWYIIYQGYANVFLVMLIGLVWHFLPTAWLQKIQAVFIQAPLVGKAIILALVYWLVFATAQEGPQPFIYFQF